MTTPDFPGFATRFAQQLSQLRTTLGPTLHQFEALGAAWIPRHLLWQVAHAGVACREAILQARKLCEVRGPLAQVGPAAQDRPGRREPRAVKRRPKPYPRLTCHRHKFREIQHKNRYYKGRPSGSRCRKSSRA